MYKNSLFKRLSRTYILAIVLPTLTVTLILTVLAFFLTDRSAIKSNTIQLQIMSENLRYFISSAEQSAERLAVNTDLQLYLNSNAKEPAMVAQMVGKAAAVLHNYVSYNSSNTTSAFLATSLYSEKLPSPYFQPLDSIDADMRAYMEKTNTRRLWFLQTDLEPTAEGSRLCYMQQLPSQNQQIVFLVITISEEALSHLVAQTIPLRDLTMVMHFPLVDTGSPDHLFIPAKLYTSAQYLEEPQGYFRQNGAIHYYNYIPELDITAVFRQLPESYSNTFYLFIAVIVLIGVGILMIRTAHMTRSLRRRVQTIVDSMTQIELGNLQIRIPNDYQQDEISYLNDSLNNLASLLGTTLDKLSKKEKAYLQSQLLALQNQINPHFVYNTLEIFRMQMEFANINETSEAIAAFGDMLRYNMDMQDEYSSLQRELEHASHYIQVMNLRYEQRICFTADITPPLETMACPKFILQPLVENAIKYNKKLLYDKGLTLSIRIYPVHNSVHIDVTDDGIGIPPTRLHQLRDSLQDIRSDQKDDYHQTERSIGLHNIAKRLRITYGENSYLILDSTEGRRTCITLILPGPASLQLEGE